MGTIRKLEVNEITDDNILAYMENILHQDTDYFILKSDGFHVGDFADTLSYLPVYRDVNSIKIGIIGDYKLEDIARIYMGNFDDCIVANSAIIDKMEEHFGDINLKCNNLKKLIYGYGIGAPVREHFGLQNNISKCISRRCESSFSEDTLLKARNYIMKKGLDDKSVILMPSAKSVTMPPLFVWERIAKRYLENGHRVFTNAMDGEPIIWKTVGISGSIDVIAAICRQVYRVISLQSGFSDLIYSYGVEADLTVLLYGRVPGDRGYGDRFTGSEKYFEKDDKRRYFFISNDDLKNIDRKIWEKLENKKDE